MSRGLTPGTTLARGFAFSDEMPWPLVRASELFELRYGKALVEGDRSVGAVPVFGTNGQCGWHDTSLFKGPGVILGRKGQGPLGVEWSSTDYWVIDTAYSLGLRGDAVDLRFAYYLIKYIGLNHLKDGTSNPSLSRDTFGAQAMPLPPRRVQERIVAILRLLDDKIELNRRMSETLEEMVRAVFKSWFVDFEPVRAKMAGRAPALMDATTASLFPSELVDGIPAGWVRIPVGDAVRVVGGGTPSTGEASFWDGPHAWARPKDLSGLTTRVLTRTERTITEAGLATISSGLLPKGTVLLSSRAPIGYLAIAQIPLAVNQGFIAMVCDRLVTSHYVLHWCAATMPEIKARAGGTTFPEISKAAFRPILMLVPSRSVLEAFEHLASPLGERQVGAVRETETLAALRDLLLPRLLSGELRVRDAERAVEKVA